MYSTTTVPDISENVGGKVLNLLEKTLSPTDSRDEALSVYLASSTGDYEAVLVQPHESVSMENITEPVNQVESALQKRPVRARKHIPGKAGGGWSSEEEENILPSISGISISCEE